MTRPHLALPLALLLTACGSDAAPTHPDAARDVALDTASDTSADVAPDTSGVPADELAPDATADVQPDVALDTSAGVAPDAPSADAAEVGSDAAEDVSVDARADVQTDASTDTASCVEGAVRCDAPITAQTCRGGVWVSTTCRGYNAAFGTLDQCYQGACFVCNASDGGAGCSTATPYCMSDAECYARERGRCVDGRCARRGPVVCASASDCAVWAVPAVMPACNTTTIAGRVTMACSVGAIERCTVDANCPTGFRCDAATGLCAWR